MPQELQEWLPHTEILTYDEIARLCQVAAGLGVRKLRVTGGEPLTRREVLTLFQLLSEIKGIEEIGLSTNGSLLGKEVRPGTTMAEALRGFKINSVNISLDTLNPVKYQQITGRDFLERTLTGIRAAQRAGFSQIKLNAVLMRHRNEDDLGRLVEFARREKLLLRFIELMPVTTTEVLTEENFLPIAEARRAIEKQFGDLAPDPDFRTNGPAIYHRFRDYPQRVGFIGAMTNLHFCESCNKLRLTCDGKLRPCLGSHLEFDIKAPLRAGATDGELRRFFLQVVDRKPQQHDFRDNYQPGRKMVAIGG